MHHTSERQGIRWGRLIGLGFLLILLLLLLVHWYWGFRGGRLLRAEIEALRAAGEPVTAVDLMEEPIPDERNAAILLAEAAKLIDSGSDTWQELKNLVLGPTSIRLPLTHHERAVMQRAFDEYSPAFPLVEQAMLRDGIDWRIDYTQGLLVTLPDLGGQRNLTTLLQAAALLAHERGNDAQAMKYLEQIRFISHAVGQQYTLVSMLVSCGMDMQRVAVISSTAPAMKISDDDSTAISTMQLRGLIAELLEGEPRRQILLRGYRGERVMQQDTIQRMLRGDMSITDVSSPNPPAQPSRSVWIPALLGPLMKEDALILIRYMNDIIAAVAQTDDSPAFHEQVPADRPVELTANRRHIIAMVLLPSLHRATTTHYRHISERHLAAVALAMRWYAVEHDGKLPASLDELVPKYLPTIPIDTLAGGGKTIGYVPDPDRPRVYHVGFNGQDNGGREHDPSASRRENERVSDEVVHLKRHPRAAVKSDEDR